MTVVRWDLIFFSYVTGGKYPKAPAKISDTGRSTEVCRLQLGNTVLVKSTEVCRLQLGNTVLVKSTVMCHLRIAKLCTYTSGNLSITLRISLNVKDI